MLIQRPLAIVIIATLLSACQPTDTPPAPSASDATPGDSAPGGEPAEVAPPAGPVAFDIDAAPVSTAPLGDFPFVTLAEGCRFDGTAPRHARAPYWTGDRIEWVEGPTVASYITAEGAADCGFANVVANMDAVIGRLQGVKVNASRLPAAAFQQISEDGALARLESGLQGVASNPLSTWLVRQADRQIWVQVVSDHTERAYNILVTERAAPAITAALLPASELKQQLDASGKVALQVNFATDSTEILADSMPQIEQVVALLRQDPALRLAVDGHTDNTGNPAHNRTLSEGRARSVVAALQGAGIDAGRLSAAGHGDTRPVADNDTEAGRARNRRVELVKQ
ncbi:MAG: OmpA family protein [Pseudoxanthomonas suwonensis]|nr:OmpA family protein [Pseudoxanthomonas suwonensis]